MIFMNCPCMMIFALPIRHPRLLFRPGHIWGGSFSNCFRLRRKIQVKKHSVPKAHLGRGISPLGWASWGGDFNRSLSVFVDDATHAEGGHKNAKTDGAAVYSIIVHNRAMCQKTMPGLPFHWGWPHDASLHFAQ